MTPERWEQIKQIYSSALEVEPGRREGFLKAACAQDEALFKEVTSLLAQEGNSAGFFESPALQVIAKALAEDKAQGPQPNLAGRTLSHYRIEKKIGEGGMGEVYRAEDTVLERKIAIKVLPDIFAGDPERLARFQREAKLLASLNHPNIAAIHGLEEHEGKRFLVLELVEGQTLSERLKKGRIPLDETLDICRQIAEGLEAAHEKGVIHRDLKPANVKVTPEGKVKILDFGLAKAFYEQAAPVDPSRSPTITEQMTAPGVILGTAAYLSPEQARGKPVDKRADIWAFGCILYECLTGGRAFSGETITETIAKILEGTPDWDGLSAATPRSICSLMRWCLQKDPTWRLRDIADARHEITAALSEPLSPESISPSFQSRIASHHLFFPLLFGTVAVALTAGILIGPGVHRYFRPVLLVPTVTHIKLEPGRVLGEGLWPRPWTNALAISPDGERIIYGAAVQNAKEADKRMLFLRRIGQLHAMAIKGTEGGVGPFVSPDGLWVGFSANGKLMKVPIEGGVPTPLCDGSSEYGATWGADGTIVFSPADYLGLSRVSSAGGNPEVLTQPEKSKGEFSHHLPHRLPDGKHLLFTIMAHAFDSQPNVAVLDMQSRTWRLLIEDGADADLTPARHLVFVRRGTLMAVRLDINRMQTIGRPVPVLEDVMQSLNTSWDALGAAQCSISETGSLVYAPGGIEPDMQNSLVWVDKKGKPKEISASKAPYYTPRLSPDGKKILYWFRQKCSLWSYDISTGAAVPLTTSGAVFYAIWKPGGKEVTFSWAVPGVMWNLFQIRADGSGQPERLTTSANTQVPGSWTPDGKYLVFTEVVPPRGYNIFIYRAEDKSVRRFSDAQSVEMYPEISPDGRWLAYVSDESGRDEVYVTPFPGPGPKVLASVEGGSEPFWARSGRRIFFTRCRNQMWAVDVIRTEPVLRVGKPHLLFEHPGGDWGGYTSGGAHRAWDISLDDEYFLATKEGDRGMRPVTEMVLVQNWFEELKRLVPTGKK